MEPITKKILILRLSSLGDLILATSVLSADWITKKTQIHWVVKSQFQDLLQANPSIHQVWSYDSKSGLKGWFNLAKELFEQEYDEVYDLHSTVRTRLLQGLFYLWKSSRKKAKWNRVSKERIRTFLYFFLKKLCPQSLRPTHFLDRYSTTVGSSTRLKPDMNYLINMSEPLPDFFEGVEEASYYCVMPSSHWRGKNWPTRRYVKLIESLPDLRVVVLGTSKDLASHKLIEALAEREIPFVNALGKLSLAQTALVLKKSLGLVGGDTGLVHLAQAVQVSSVVLFGPTMPQVGFGPWTLESRAVHHPVWCQPCSKDGKRCYRAFRKYQCLEELSEQVVQDAMSSFLKTKRIPQKEESKNAGN